MIPSDTVVVIKTHNYEYMCFLHPEVRCVLLTFPLPHFLLTSDHVLMVQVSRTLYYKRSANNTLSNTLFTSGGPTTM